MPTSLTSDDMHQYLKTSAIEVTMIQEEEILNYHVLVHVYKYRGMSFKSDLPLDICISAGHIRKDSFRCRKTVSSP